ncbi:MAG: hypothetical protein IKO19_08670 [Candidatus Riflebacteria bacterium]|nr:hypothetical protein [Candidatus Riflebacteria bacterium]
MEKKKKSYLGIAFTTFLILVITYIIFMPNFRKGGGRDPRITCYSNLRVIQGAVEMYNMDIKTMMTDLDIERLIEGKYLKEKPRSPRPECRYFSDGDLTDTGEICCEIHGGLIAEANSDIIRKEEREKRIEEIRSNLSFHSIRILPALLYLIFALM